MAPPELSGGAFLLCPMSQDFTYILHRFCIDSMDFTKGWHYDCHRVSRFLIIPDKESIL